MGAPTVTGHLTSEPALAAHLAALANRDPRLAPVIEKAGEVRLRTAPQGFAGLAQIVCGQQLSVASARAIWSRFEALPGALAPETYLALSEADVRATGFSLGKWKTLRSLSEALLAGGLDMAALHDMPADAAIAALTALPGIGPWTAEVYLLFSAGHPDVFPAGDLALQKAVAHGLGLAARPDAKAIRPIVAGWSPHRGAAALLFWRYFAALRDREGIAL